MKVVRKSIKIAKKPRVYKSNQGWRVVGGRKVYFKSGWEVNFAIYLEFLKTKFQIKDWHYEPERFWFNAIKTGTRCYTPDFKIIRNNDTHYWVEVKGYMDSKSQTKIKRFNKYYPKEELHIVQKQWFIEHKRRLPVLCDNWENDFTEGEKDVD